MKGISWQKMSAEARTEVIEIIMLLLLINFGISVYFFAFFVKVRFFKTFYCFQLLIITGLISNSNHVM